MTITLSSTRIPMWGFEIQDRVVRFNILISTTTKAGEVLKLSIPCSFYAHQNTGEEAVIANIAQLDPAQVYEGSLSGNLYIKKDRLSGGVEVINALALSADSLWIPVMAPGSWAIGAGSGQGCFDCKPRVTVTGLPSTKIRTHSFDRGGEPGGLISGSVQATSTKVGDSWENLYLDWVFFSGSPGYKGAEILADASKDPSSSNVAAIEVRGELAIEAFETRDGQSVTKLKIDNAGSLNIVRNAKAKTGSYTAPAAMPPMPVPGMTPSTPNLQVPPPQPVSPSAPPPPSTPPFSPGDAAQSMANAFSGEVSIPGNQDYDEIPF